MCVECHSERDGSGNIIEGQKFVGGNIPFVPPSSEWATRVPRNRGLPGYTDAMAMRLLTQGGIGRDGKPLKPPMPRFRMTPQDAADVIAICGLSCSACPPCLGEGGFRMLPTAAGGRWEARKVATESMAALRRGLPQRDGTPNRRRADVSKGSGWAASGSHHDLRRYNLLREDRCVSCCR
jgi:hypothetical protein